MQHISNFRHWHLSNMPKHPDKLTLTLATSRAISPRYTKADFGQRVVVSVNYKGATIPHAGLRVGTIITDNNGDFRSGGGTNASYSATNAVNNVLVPINLKGNDKDFKVVITRPKFSPNPAGLVEITNVFVHSSNNFPWARPPKTRFDNGGYVRVEPNGRMYLHNEPFVPLGIMMSRRRQVDDIKRLAAQGFNLNMWAASERQAKLSVDGGLNYMLTLTPYLWGRKGWAYRKWSQLENWYSKIVRSGLFSHCVGAYIDNEAYEEHAAIDQCVKVFRSVTDQVPIYALQGNYGLAPKFAQLGWSDITGTYISPENSGGAATGRDGIRFLHHNAAQTNPVVFGQRNGDPAGQDLLDAAGTLVTGTSYWGDDRKWVERHRSWNKYPTFAGDFTALVLDKTKLGPSKPPVPTPEPVEEEYTVDLHKVVPNVTAKRLIFKNWEDFELLFGKGS